MHPAIVFADGANPVYIADCRGSRPHENADGIVDLRNAAPVLLEIVAAAQAWMDAERKRDEALRLMNDATNSDDYSAACTLLPPIGRDRDVALSRLTAALAKVTP